METVLQCSGEFLDWLWRASWQASVVIVLVLVLQWLLRKHLSARWRHALWLLVVVRLALPWSLESRVSLFNLFSPRWESPRLLTQAAPAEVSAAGPVQAVPGQNAATKTRQGEA